MLASKLRSCEEEPASAKDEIEAMSLDLVVDRQQLKRMLASGRAP